MTAHATHSMHDHSLQALASLRLADRERQVLEALGNDRLTDRQIAARMGSADPNVARPRITALRDRGILHEVGAVKEGRRKVRIVARVKA
jgi:hypothetical protein